MSSADEFVAMFGMPDVDVTSDLFAFVDATSDLVGVVDEESRFVYLNHAARKRLGVGDWTGLTTADVFPPQTFAQYYDEIRPTLVRDGTWDGELAVLSASGETQWMAMSLVARGGPGGDITRLIAVGRELQPAAGGPNARLVVDELTGLAGRAILNDRISVALAHAARDGRGVAVIVVDVDAMKDINDSYGHSTGDEVLRSVARNMSDAVRASDTVARVGGDEFVVLLDELDEPDTAGLVAERIRESVSRVLVTADGDAPGVTASFGLAAATRGDSATSLLERADAAMYRGKALGGGQVTVLEDSNDADTTALITELAYAVSHGLIKQYVSSVVDLDTGALVAYQGLARWAHPHRGLLDAEHFIPAAASTPLIPVIDLDVLRRTAMAASRRQRDGLPIHAYAHLSRRLLGDPDLVRYLDEIIDAAEIAPHDLRVEISHTLLTRRSRAVEAALQSLHELGVRTVLAGVDGECAVNEIVEHGFHELRLARHLIHDTASDDTRRRVTEATIALARSLGLTVTAVGIEAQSEHDHMRDLGCDYGEGHLYGPPREAG
jgi:diguanylate cyclase (GGDEF)-like protein